MTAIYAQLNILTMLQNKKHTKKEAQDKKEVNKNINRNKMQKHYGPADSVSVPKVEWINTVLQKQTG